MLFNLRSLYFPLFIMIWPLMVHGASANTKCAIATGKIICESDKTKAADAEVFLMDDDGTLNPDDQMGWSTADEEGKFRVEGCGYDFMSTPDPYVKIFTYCNAEKGKYTKTKVVYKFSPEVIEYGDIIVD